MIAAAVTLVALLAPQMNGAHTHGPSLLASACRQVEMAVVLPAAYEWQPDLAIGRWSGGTDGWSFSEDGAVYPTQYVAATCPTYP